MSIASKYTNEYIYIVLTVIFTLPMCSEVVEVPREVSAEPISTLARTSSVSMGAVPIVGVHHSLHHHLNPGGFSLQ